MTEPVSHMWLDSDELEQADPVFFDADEELAYELGRKIVRGDQLVLSGSVAADLDADEYDMPLDDWVRFEPETLDQAYRLRGGATPDVMLADFMGPAADAEADAVEFVVRAAIATPTPFKGVAARPSSFAAPDLEAEVAAAAAIATRHDLHAIVVLGATSPAEVAAVFGAVPASWTRPAVVAVPAYVLASDAFDSANVFVPEGSAVASWGFDLGSDPLVSEKLRARTRCWVASDSDRSIDIARFSLTHFE